MTPRDLPRVLGTIGRVTRDWARLARADVLANRRHTSAPERFLVLRHAGLMPGFYDILLDFLAERFPEVRARFELHPLPSLVDWSRIRLHVPWLQDPVEGWSRLAFALARRLEAACDRRGVPVVNRVSRLANAGKVEGARRIAEAGLCTARMRRIDDAAAFKATRLGLSYPLFVREDWGHGGELVRLDDDAALAALDLSRFERPVAVELVDVRSPDGLVRKRRYVVAGDVGVALSMHVSDGWLVRGSGNPFSEALRDEELAYLARPLPWHDRFVRAREALGLDFVAFDWSLLPSGEPIVWEANPYPFLHMISGRRGYRREPTTRVLAAMARLYLQRARLPIPDELEALTRLPNER